MFHGTNKNENWNDSLIQPFTTPRHVNGIRVDKQYIGHTAWAPCSIQWRKVAIIKF